jgi:hypothetical protein
MPVLDIMVAALLAFHDVVDGARGGVLAVVPRTTPQLTFLALVVTLM